jgi:hypothetical protein
MIAVQYKYILGFQIHVITFDFSTIFDVIVKEVQCTSEIAGFLQKCAPERIVQFTFAMQEGMKIIIRPIEKDIEVMVGFQSTQVRHDALVSEDIASKDSEVVDLLFVRFDTLRTVQALARQYTFLHSVVNSRYYRPELATYTFMVQLATIRVAEVVPCNVNLCNCTECSSRLLRGFFDEGQLIAFANDTVFALLDNRRKTDRLVTVEEHSMICAQKLLVLQSVESERKVFVPSVTVPHENGVELVPTIPVD